MINERKGFFTSSNIYRLVAKGKAEGSVGAPFFTYVREKRREIKAGRSVNNEAEANANTWGYVCEPIVHDLLGLEYVLEQKKRYLHLYLPWSGAPDGRKVHEETLCVTDIKSPFTLTSFFDLQEAVEGAWSYEVATALSKAKKEWYWQLVSNKILTSAGDCELILFMPRKWMLGGIREKSYEMGYWHHNKTDDQLPWLADDSEVECITKIAFTPPQEDEKFLTSRVELAAKCLEYQGDLSLEKYVESLNENK